LDSGGEVMNISYDPKEDILVIEFSPDKIVRDISLNWNVNVGLTDKGVGEIIILDAKESGFLPVAVEKSATVA
jgi:uncharacterized protein YuzE